MARALRGTNERMIRMSNRGASIAAISMGMPVDPDVRRLMDAFPDIEEGQVISNDDIAEVIGVDYGSNRFRTVRDNWIKRVESVRRYLLAPVRGQGVERLPENRRMDHAASKVRRGIRGIGRGAAAHARVERSLLNAAEQKTYDHRSMVIGRMSEDAKRSAKELSPPPPHKSIRAPLQSVGEKK